MTPRQKNAFDVFCQDAFDLLAGAGVPYLVIGGLAVIAVGEARTTADVDAVIFASPARAERLIDEAARAGFEVVAQVERERLCATGTLRFRKSPFQLDLILASLPFEDAALARATKRRLFGKIVPLPTPRISSSSRCWPVAARTCSTPKASRTGTAAASTAPTSSAPCSRSAISPRT